MTLIDNKYKKIYYNIVEKRKQFPISKENEYCESHHIIPKCLGGTDDSENIVNLTAREHLVVHKLLTKCTEGKAKRSMYWAYHRMIYCNQGNVKITSREYEHFRKTWSKFLSENHSSVTNSEWSEKVSQSLKKNWENDIERKQKASEALKKYNDKRRNEDPVGWLKEQKRRSKLGAQAAKKVLQKDIEYYDKVYKGWDGLKEQTGVSKFLYNKFYKNGIDPTFRIGKDGPMDSNEIQQLIELFCNNHNVDIPSELEEKKNILERMSNIGLITKKQKNKLIQS